MHSTDRGPAIARLADRDVGDALGRAWRLARSAAPETLDAFEAAWRAASTQRRADEAVFAAAAAVCLVDGYYSDFAAFDTWCARLDDVASPIAGGEADRLVVLGARALRAMHACHDSGRAWVSDAIAWLRSAEDADRALCGASALVLALDTARNDAEATRIEVAAARLEAHASPWFAAHWLSVRAQHALYFHRLDGVAAPLAGAREIAAEHGLRPIAVVATLVAARCAIARGDFAGARMELDAVEPLDAEREPMWRAMAEQLAALCELRTGHFDRALHAARRATAFAEKARAPDDESLQMRILEGYCCAGVGDGEGAARILREAVTRAAPMQRRQLDAVAGLLEGEVLARAGQATAARDRLGGALAQLRSLGYSGFLWPVPKVAARLCALALEHGVEPDYVRSVIRLRSLEPPQARSRAWPWACTIDSLGGFDVRVEGEAPQVDGARGRGKPIELLTTLIALGGRAVPIGELIRLLWPGEGRVGAQSAFDVTLSRLRRLLRIDGLLVLQDRRLGLDARRVDLDRWALEAAIDASARAARGELAAAVARVVDCYPGPLLPGDGAAWIVAERAKLRRRVDVELARVADELPRRDAATLLTRALAADPELDLAAAALAGIARRQG